MKNKVPQTETGTMVRLLTETDIPKAMDFAETDPAIHTFLIGNLENYNPESEDVTLWGQFAEDRLVGVLIRYFKSFMLYTISDHEDVAAFAGIIQKYEGETDVISAKNAIVEKLIPYFDCPKIERTLFCELKQTVSTPEDDGVRLAALDDMDAVYDLLKSIPEFSPPIKAALVKAVEAGTSRIYIMMDGNGRAVSMARTAAENRLTAIIVNVCTQAEHRNQGYMRRVMMRLCADLQREGKALCLFYSSPEAGRIYHSMGFEITGDWTMMKFK